MAQPTDNVEGLNNDELSLEELRKNLPPSRAGTTPDPQALKVKSNTPNVNPASEQDFEAEVELLGAAEQGPKSTLKKPKFVRDPSTGGLAKKVWRNGKYVTAVRYKPVNMKRGNLPKKDGQAGLQDMGRQEEQPGRTQRHLHGT
ncbi:hypothetical protein AAVH_20859 [Aphelenchoides avenae]|nr:hypothetical protein AAVH_20859 [Aphelenchus avenae]